MDENRETRAAEKKGAVPNRRNKREQKTACADFGAKKSEHSASELAEKQQKRAEKAARKAEKRRIRAEKRLLKVKRAPQPKVKPIKNESYDEQIERRVRELSREQRYSAGWYDLDNAALIFPASDTHDMSNMFRQGVVLREEVDPITLQRAVNLIMPRFPSLTSALKKGVFWYYLEPASNPLVIEKEHTLPCRTMPLDAGSPLIRVGYYGNRIFVEYSHAATDGNGGITFLNSLLGCYFRLKGEEIKDRTNCLNHLDKPRPEEISDDYLRFCDKVKRKRPLDKRAYRLQGKKLPYGSLITVTGVMSAQELREAAKRKGLTVGQLITLCLFKAIEQDRRFYISKDRSPVIIGVPTNIRKHFDSETLRNFVALMHISSDNETDESKLIESIKRQFSEQDSEEFLRAYVNFNVNAQKNGFFSVLPLPVKNFVLKIAMSLFGNRATTCTFSNLGVIKAPVEFKDKVLRYDFNLGPQPTVLTSVGACTYEGVTTLTFARVIEESGVEKRFFRELTALGVSVALESERIEEGV